MEPCGSVSTRHNQAQVPATAQEAVVPPAARVHVALGGVVEPVEHEAVQVPFTTVLAQAGGHVALAGVPFAGLLEQTEKC